MKTRFYLPLALAALVPLVAWTAPAQLQRTDSTRQAWEYVEIQLPSDADATPTLNQFGAQGWELIGVVSACPGGYTDCGFFAYLKRAG